MTTAATDLLPLHDSALWPLRMTAREVAYVCRCSVRTIQRRVDEARMPGPDADGFYLRTEIAQFLQGGVRRFDRSYRRAS